MTMIFSYGFTAWFTILCTAFFPAATRQEEARLVIKRTNYTFRLEKKGCRYAFFRPDGKLIAGFHSQSGVQLSAASDTIPADANVEKIIQENDTLLEYLVATQNRTRATVRFHLYDAYVRLQVRPEVAGKTESAPSFVMDARTAPLSPAYGLGDHGGYGASTNVSGFASNQFLDTDNGHRFVSNFTVFPAQGMAQVLFEKGHKRVAVTQAENRLGAANVRAINVYYFFGTMPEIYQQYALVRKQGGYPDLKPKYAFFDVGYEAFGSLGWNTYQTSVQQDMETYLKKGYPIKWAVVGSGFWKGERKNPWEGATTSFGIWDDTAQPGRKDSLPNPRYPDVAGFKQFFIKRDILLLLGLRINFKSVPADSGYYLLENDGVFTRQGLENQYFVTRSSGKPGTFSVNFPQGNVYLLDGNNSQALQWYKAGVKKWGVRGFKEDTMLKDGVKLNDDAKCNAVNEMLMREGYYVMARNAAYSVPGDIIRLEDTKYGFDQDRPVINVLNYAASGAPNTYPDIVAGKYLTLPLTEDQKRYFVRNALFAAVCPAMSVGLGPWQMENKAYEKAVKKAVDWHHQFAPYIYSAAVESYLTSYPHTMTPLPITFPDDTSTYHLASKARRQYAWMLGASLLATPAYGNDYATVQTRDVYLPEGTWMDYETGQVFQGPHTLKNYSFPDDKIPVFVGGKGILVSQGENIDDLWAAVYPVTSGKSVYTYYYPDGQTSSRIASQVTNWAMPVSVTDVTTHQSLTVDYVAGNHAIRFRLTAGHDYVIKNQ